MTFEIKPPLYALDREQIHDLLVADNIDWVIKAQLSTIKHFPIVKTYFFENGTGLLLFERFTPFQFSWASDYVEKLYYFYKSISSSAYYRQAWFNGYGLTDFDYGDLWEEKPPYTLNIPETITIENNSDQELILTFFKKSFPEEDIYFSLILQRVEVFTKRFIIVPPKSTYPLKTDLILFGSMVASGVNNIEEQVSGIPHQLKHENLDFYLNQIKQEIDDSFPYLNQCLSSIDYEVKAACWNTTAFTTGSVQRTYYFTNYKEDSLNLTPTPSWYFYTSLIYANNDYWHSGEELKTDLGKPIHLEIYDIFLSYSVWASKTVTQMTSSDVVAIPLLTIENNDIVETEVKVYLLYNGLMGEASYVKVILPDPNINPLDVIWGEYYPYNRDAQRYNQQESTFPNLFRYSSQQAIKAWSNQGLIPDIDPRLFAEYNGLAYAFITPLVGCSFPNQQLPQRQTPVLSSDDSFYRKFFYTCNCNLATNHFSISPSDSNSFKTNISNKATDYHEELGLIYLGGGYNEGEFDDPEFNLNLYPSGFNRSAPAFFVTDKWTNRLTTIKRSSPLETSQTVSNQVIIDYVNNIIDNESTYHEFMPDSARIMEIHAALQADKFANDYNDPEFYRVASLGYYIERIARVLGISVDPDGSIRSIRQRAFVESGETIPPGWPMGQWGRNQGGSDEGQVGGSDTEDRDGITYPIISNKFGLDPYTGEAKKVTEGGYALCENLIQYLETFKDDLDKALGMQYSGANSFPLVQGSGTVSYEGLSVLVQENTYMLSQLSRIISSAQISSLITQAIVIELMAHQGIPTIIKELSVTVGDNDVVKVPYPAFPENAPTNFDHFLQLLMNLSPLLGGKVNLRKDLKKEEEK